MYRRLLLFVLLIFITVPLTTQAQEDDPAVQAFTALAEIENYESYTLTASLFDVLIYKVAGTEEEFDSYTRIYAGDYAYTQTEDGANALFEISTFDTIGPEGNSLDTNWNMEGRLVDEALYLSATDFMDSELAAPEGWHEITSAEDLALFPTSNLYPVLDSLQNETPLRLVNLNVYGTLDIDFSPAELAILPDHVHNVTVKENELENGRIVTDIIIQIDTAGVQLLLGDDMAEDSPFYEPLQAITPENNVLMTVSLDEQGQAVQVSFVPQIALYNIALDEDNPVDLVYTGLVVFTFNTINEPVEPVSTPEME